MSRRLETAVLLILAGVFMIVASENLREGNDVGMTVSIAVAVLALGLIVATWFGRHDRFH